MSLFQSFARMRAFACALLFVALASAAQAQTQRLRIGAGNVTSGNFQSYQDPGKRILGGLDLDVVALQEFNIFVSGGSSASQSVADTNAWVQATFGPGWFWSREGGGEQIPNGVVSKWPILESGEFVDSNVSNRDFAWARIDIPGDHDLWVVSVHLLTSGASIRNTQATALKNALIAKNIPAADYIYIGGDFNTDGTGEACLSTLTGYLGGARPTQRDQNGNTGTNAGRNKPYDWVLTSGNLSTLETNVNLTAQTAQATYNQGMVIDTRVFSSKGTLADISPAQANDSDADQMQHMAIIRDFLIPVSTNDFTVSGNAVAFGQHTVAGSPYNNSTITLTVAHPFTLSSVGFTGGFASEFSLVSPTPPAAISASTPLQFRWTPAANDGLTRSVQANFTTTGSPNAFAITLTGSTPANYSVAPATVDFGNVNAASAPFNNNSATITATSPFNLTGVSFLGDNASEFQLVSPASTATITGSAALNFRWSPASNNGVQRTVTARFTTNSAPASFDVVLQGRPVRDIELSAESIDFGTVDAASAPFTDNSASLVVNRPVQITGVQFSGAGAGEVSITSPNLNALPLALSATTPLVFSWRPTANNGQVRAVTATLTTNGNPATLTVLVNGATQNAGGGGVAIDISGWHLVQANSTVTYTFPASTVLQAGQFAVVGRDRTQAEFESFWSVTLGANVKYFDGITVTGANGFPVINGAETFTLTNAANATIEGPTGAAVVVGKAYQRTSTSAAATTAGSWTEVAQTSATPGTFAGTKAGTNQIRITEYSDAATFQDEFVEIINDASSFVPPTAPAPPATFQATAGSGAIALSWGAVAGADGYQIYRGTAAGGPYVKINAAAISGLSLNDASAANGVTYFYVVRAIKSGVESVNSVERSARLGSSEAQNWQLYR